MAFEENLAERIRQRLARRKNIDEKKMFGGIGFLLNGNMLVGVWKDSLIVRLEPDEADEALTRQACGSLDSFVSHSFSLRRQLPNKLQGTLHAIGGCQG